MKVAITGAKGVVGKALIGQLDPKKFQITEIDLPEHNAGDFDDLLATTAEHDALIHLAWKDMLLHTQGNTVDPANNHMAYLAYQAAVQNKIMRVVMGSSNHAHSHDLRDPDGRIRASTEPPEPDSPYGAEKLYMEALGRYYARAHDLGIVCVRIGNINIEDKPQDQSPQRWMSYRDWGRLITLCLEAPTIPDNFQIVYGVSRQEVFDWTNPFGYGPLDSAE